METIPSAYNWKLTVRRENGGVTLLRCVTDEKRAALPETLWGLPVTALGRRALSPSAAPVEGEEVRLVCGGARSGEWNNAALRDLTLPAALRRVEDYAFFNCRALRTLRLSDGVEHWGSGVLMNCRELSAFVIDREGEDRGTVAYFAGELSRELDIRLRRGGETFLRLIFPEYTEIYEENCPAHHFDYTIDGAGYPYRNCFRQRRLNLPEYDRLWNAYQAVEQEAPTALRLAWWRLRYPWELSEPGAKLYRRYLRTHGEAAGQWLIARRDGEGLGRLLSLAEPDRDTLASLTARAREAAFSEGMALLLEWRHRRFAAGEADRFAL